MRILLTAAVAASLAAGTLSATAETAKPAKPVACTKVKDEAACTARTDCTWAAPTGKQKAGKCKAAPKKK